MALACYVQVMELVSPRCLNKESVVPDKWLVGVIKPIYKIKGKQLTLTIIELLRYSVALVNYSPGLTTYAENVNLITMFQSGFRKSYSTTDNIFILQCLIELLFTQKKNYSVLL